ncbi:hypothetical protein Raf01_58230 [Rugosimonospora africana]|uniref:Uncharacterized protein n=1 Tax=Rugosimonospora africana TaxID=556532 RepID=A0A8J3VTG9_9ACTN|nr:hypothetical protein Raf01_58230 [Rugosimonospora africana]
MVGAGRLDVHSRTPGGPEGTGGALDGTGIEPVVVGAGAIGGGAIGGVVVGGAIGGGVVGGGATGTAAGGRTEARP